VPRDAGPVTVVLVMGESINAARLSVVGFNNLAPLTFIQNLRNCI